MQFLLYPHLFVDKYAALLPKLNLDEDELGQIHNRAEGRTPNETFVDHCLAWLNRFETTKPAAA